MRRIVIVAFDQAQLLDIAGPVQVFASARDLAALRALPDPYEIAVVSPEGGAIATSSGLPVVTLPLAALGGKPVDTVIAVGGLGSRQAQHDARLVRWIAAEARRARRICSVCTGAFLLGAAGLLDGRRVATHWWAAAELQRRYPAAKVDPDPIFLRDGKVWTSAGVTAGIDLALALVEEDLGRGMALAVARHLVVFLKRPGGQSQFSAMLRSQAADEGRFAALHDWLAQNLSGDLRVEVLAARLGMSPRNFARLYRQRTGTTPAKTVEQLRLEAARRALEDGSAPIAAIARAAGFGDEERMRRSFLRHLGVAPQHYRQRFSRGADRPALAREDLPAPAI
ncbi:MAG TPA: GlxA family transcriptional regulator [Stellaceae bacterium]|nr:GlxA family transcriptional regulator [Stellaceae bacterium]